MAKQICYETRHLGFALNFILSIFITYHMRHNMSIFLYSNSSICTYVKSMKSHIHKSSWSCHDIKEKTKIHKC